MVNNSNEWMRRITPGKKSPPVVASVHEVSKCSSKHWKKKKVKRGKDTDGRIGRKEDFSFLLLVAITKPCAARSCHKPRTIISSNLLYKKMQKMSWSSSVPLPYLESLRRSLGTHMVHYSTITSAHTVV